MSATATRRALGFASIVFVVLVLTPSSAHGSWYLGLVIPPALFLVAAQVELRWRDRAAFGAALASFACLAAAHAIYWMFTFPANQAAVNWTAKPTDFQRVRAQWEWSHGAGALLNLAAFAALLWAVQSSRASSARVETCATAERGSGAPSPHGDPSTPQAWGTQPPVYRRSTRTSGRAPR